MVDNAAQTYEIEVFFDGGCPLCQREIGLLKRWDRHRRIRFTDIDDAVFQPADVGLTRDALMAQMHGRLPCGTWVTGVEVFRQMYAAVGYGSLARLTRLPIISQLLDLGYSVFARYRLTITGRCTTATCSTTAAKGGVFSVEKERR